MTCKECVHYGVCAENAKLRNESLDVFEEEGIAEHCEYFIPKARFVEVPDDQNIIFVKDNWLMLNVESEYLGKAIKHCVDYLTKDAKERGK